MIWGTNCVLQAFLIFYEIMIYILTFKSVMEKLPPTSYVRMVDIWLICGQLIPFLEVILLTMLELYNEEDTVNHHGFSRKIDINSIQDRQVIIGVHVSFQERKYLTLQ